MFNKITLKNTLFFLVVKTPQRGGHEILIFELIYNFTICPLFYFL
jgi:hypothetical protein